MANSVRPAILAASQAEAHTVLLPHSTASSSAATPKAMDRIARALNSTSAAQGLYDLEAGPGVPLSLKAIGMKGNGIEHAAELAAASSFYNPRRLDRDAICEFLKDAFEGCPPRVWPAA